MLLYFRQQAVGVQIKPNDPPGSALCLSFSTALWCAVSPDPKWRLLAFDPVFYIERGWFYDWSFYGALARLGIHPTWVTEFGNVFARQSYHSYLW